MERSFEPAYEMTKRVVQRMEGMRFSVVFDKMRVAVVNKDQRQARRILMRSRNLHHASCCMYIVYRISDGIVFH
jgi:hypothetical protein